MRRLAPSLAALVLACSAADEGDALAPELGLGKADAADHVTMQGALDFVGERTASFVEDLEFHGYVLAVAPDSTTRIELSHLGSSSKLDATMFVYGPRTDAGFGTEAMAFDDDSGWGKLPRLRDLELEEGGEYLVVVGTHDGRGRGHYRLVAQCESGDCTPDPVPTGCVFGDTYRDALRNPVIAVNTPRTVLTIDSEIDAGRAEQIVVAVQQSSHTDVTTLAEAFDRVDQNEVILHELWDVSNARAVTVIEYGAGDNSYGAFFAFGSTDVLASIHDGDLLDCTVPPGPRGIDCTSANDCAAGLQCFGQSDDVALGKCVEMIDHPAESSACSAAAPCPFESGLSCAGLTRGDEGLCFPAWMRSTFAVEVGTTVPAGGLQQAIPVYGLATVDMDVDLEMRLRAPYEPGPIRITLTNPATAEVVVLEADGTGDDIFVNGPVIGFSGDEQVNGTWTLGITGAEGGMIELGVLRIGSRFD